MSVERLIPKGKLGTCGTVVDELVEKLDSLAEIYVCVKFKDGTSDIFLNGTLEGFTFAILMLQNKALEALNGDF